MERTVAPAGVPAVASSAPAVISDQVIPVPTIVLPSLPAWSTLLFLLVVQRIHDAVRDSESSLRCDRFAASRAWRGRFRRPGRRT